MRRAQPASFGLAPRKLAVPVLPIVPVMKGIGSEGGDGEAPPPPIGCLVVRRLEEVLVGTDRPVDSHVALYIQAKTLDVLP